MSAYYFTEEEIEEQARELEKDGKITEEACTAYLCEDYEGYWREMRDAAEMVLEGYEPYFLSEEEIKELTEQYGAPAPPTEDYHLSDDDSLSDDDYRSDYNYRSDYDQQSDYDYRPTIPPLPQYDYSSSDLSLGSYFGCCFQLVMWIFMIASGLFVPYLIYKLAKLFIKALIKSR